MTLHAHGLVLVRQVGHLVVVLGDVEVHVPVDVVGADDVGIDAEFHAPVDHVAHIVIIAAVA